MKNNCSAYKKWGGISLPLFLCLVITLALFAMSLIFLTSSKEITDYIQHKSPITILLKKGVTQENREDLSQQIKLIDGVSEVYYTTTSNNLLVTINKEVDKSELIELISKSIENNNTLAKSNYSIQTSNLEAHKVHNAAMVLFILSIACYFTTIYFIINGSFSADKKTLLNMQLIGTSNKYIQEPYIFKNFCTSLLAGVFITAILGVSHILLVSIDHTIRQIISVHYLCLIISITIFFSVVSVYILTKLILIYFLHQNKK